MTAPGHGYSISLPIHPRYILTNNEMEDIH